MMHKGSNSKLGNAKRKMNVIDDDQSPPRPKRGGAVTSLYHQAKLAKKAPKNPSLGPSQSARLLQTMDPEDTAYRYLQRDKVRPYSSESSDDQKQRTMFHNKSQSMLGHTIDGRYSEKAGKMKRLVKPSSS